MAQRLKAEASEHGLVMVEITGLEPGSMLPETALEWSAELKRAAQRALVTREAKEVTRCAAPDKDRDRGER